MQLHYDFHMHSCLSPCGSEDMTPYNLVNMAALQGLEAIALTDHNSSRNCPAAIAAGREAGITVIPGMELTTSEEAHVVCLFPTLSAALEFDRLVYARLPDIANRPDIFGDQWIMDEGDQITDAIPKLLINATDISLMEVTSLVGRYGGFCYPAHIDKNAYSILASLGDFPPECGFRAAEISAAGQVEALTARYPILQTLPLVCSSDAHYLEQILPPAAWLETPENTPAAILAALSAGCRWSRG
ncbi:MAG: PHP domain-containing protein [Clostridiales bacterium]|nr:PHP domain-containing protein [Clostridiales bacterium]